MIQDMKDIKGEGPISLLLYDPVALLILATSVESVETLMVGLMNYWKTVDPTDAVLQKQAADIYAKAMLRRKALAQAGKPQPSITPAIPSLATLGLLSEIAKTPLLKPSMVTFEELVTHHPTLTFEEATERLTQSMMANILSLYSTKVPTSEIGAFIEQIAKTLEFKRKIILSGKVGHAYKKIWATVGGHVLQVITEPIPDVVLATIAMSGTDTSTTPVPAKSKTAKKSKPPVDTGVPFWRNVTELCAVVYPACGAAHLTGLTIGAVSPSTEQAMLTFAKKEVTFFQKSGGISLPLAVGKYNFLMTLFANPVSATPFHENQVMADLEGTQYVIEVMDSVVRVRLTGEVPV